jgi:uncharacterized protein
MVPQDLLDILVCPACRTPLVLEASGSSLKCCSCRRVFPIRDNIPVLLLEEAVVEGAGK